MSQSGGHLLVKSLVALGARHAFGVPGESYLDVLDALFDTQGTFDFTMCRNEGGAAFMAAAYGKLTGQPGICLVTRGPGATNASIGIHTAMQDSAPMLVFVGQVGTHQKGREAFQELDYRAVFGTMAKWAVEIDDVDRIPEILARAWSLAVSGRPGPVVVALPEDMLTATTDAPVLSGPTALHEPAPSADALAQAQDLLASAARPLIITGGCNWTDAGIAALEAFAESSDIPTLAAFRFHDRFNNHSAVYAGEAGVGMLPHVARLIREADVILAINIRFGEMTTGAYSLFDAPNPVQTIIHTHSSDLEIGKIYQPTLGIHAGPNAMATALEPVTGAWSGWRETARADYAASQIAPPQPSPVDMSVVMPHLTEVLPADAILTNGAGNFAIWPNKHFAFGPNHRLLAPQSGAMGYGLPAAIVAQIVYPERRVVCFAGDGDFQMNCQELATAAQAGAAPIVLILNNGIYGTIRAHQERHYPDRVSGTSMSTNPDFAALARAYGFYGERVETTEGFKAAFARALASETGAVLDLNISAEALTPRKTLSQIRDEGLLRN
ncbi:MAG: thiamine pyrophosphate-dependent enzyme [Pseudomonadota bacterium]